MFLIYTGFFLIALIDFFPLLKKRKWLGAVAWLFLFLPAVAITVLKSTDIEIPSVLLLLGKAVKAVGLSY